ncbi:DUF7097 family protein [Halovenus marina]|uniref:DUF7097 family protein n=1 Tax=Halovenus marina TaxID=3396621 RepID=UPI003F54A3B6
MDESDGSGSGSDGDRSTSSGTDTPRSVGVEDPYSVVETCDFLTDDGRCRFAVEHSDRDPQFANERRAEEFRCPVAGDPDETGPTGPWEWADCPHFRCRNRERACRRCGLEEVRLAHEETRPLLEEHHLSYADRSSQGSGDTDHEITVYLCRWCHAKVHDSWARIDDDATPDAEAIAEREQRRSQEQRELGFESASQRSADR